MAPAPDATHDAWVAAITAAMLRRGAMIHRLAMGVAAVVFVVSIIGGGLAVRFSAATVIASLALALACVEFYLAARVAFDADLFDELARRDADLAGFDGAMTAQGLLPTKKAGRPMEQRVRGALRLLKLQAGACAAQVFVALVGGVMIVIRIV